MRGIEERRRTKKYEEDRRGENFFSVETRHDRENGKIVTDRSVRCESVAFSVDE